MSVEVMDTIVVGAGPAGLSAAITMARAGLDVVVVERGASPGSKNVMGGMLHAHSLANLLPGFWEDAPLERHVVDQGFWMMDETRAASMSFRRCGAEPGPTGGFTVLRARFDEWLAQKAEEAGAMILPSVTADELIWSGDRVVGVTSELAGDELYGLAVVLADGVNSTLAEKAGLRKPLTSGQVALAVKETIELPADVIEARFNLSGGEGVALQMVGALTRGMVGTGFLYTNRDSISLGLGVMLSDLAESGAEPNELIEGMKVHPAIAPLIDGGRTVEFAAHLIPEAGYDALPKLVGDGVLLVGDAALLVNTVHTEGANLAVESGRLAGEAIVRAKEIDDWSLPALEAYEGAMRASYVFDDLRKYRRATAFFEENRDIFSRYPAFLMDALEEMLSADGRPKSAKQSRIVAEFSREVGWPGLARLLLGGAWSMI